MAGKLNGYFYKAIIFVITVVFSAGGVYAIVGYRLNNLEGDVAEVEAKAQSASDEIIGIKKDIYYIRLQADRILKEIKDLKNERTN